MCFWRGCYVYAFCGIDRGNASRGTASPGASFQSSQVDKADDSPLPELGGRAARELRLLGETPHRPAGANLQRAKSA